MNHNEDIEDGLEEFQAERERAAAEREYLRCPRLFDKHVVEPPFIGLKATSVVLVGRRTKETGHPFDFENGFVSVDGVAGDVPHVLDLRWSDNGSTVDASLRKLL